MPVGPFFHLMHMVDDFDAAASFFDELLSPTTFMPKHWSKLDKRWASLARVGDDFVLELLEASREPEDQALPLPRFAARFGQHLHSLAWLVPDTDWRPTFDELRAGGVRVAGPSGGVFPPGPVDGELPTVVFTHPKDTFGQVELMVLDRGARDDPRYGPGWDPEAWRSRPLGIVRTSHITNLAADLDRAVEVFSLFGGKEFLRMTDADGDHAHLFVGTQTVIDLLSPAPGTAARRDQDANGDLPYAVTFTVADLDRAARHVEGLGVRTTERGGDTIVLEPDDCHGARMTLTTAELPGDPRLS